jgi:hypothetical protein
MPRGVRNRTGNRFPAGSPTTHQGPDSHRVMASGPLLFSGTGRGGRTVRDARAVDDDRAPSFPITCREPCSFARRALRSSGEAWIPDTLRSCLAHAAGNDGARGARRGCRVARGPGRAHQWVPDSLRFAPASGMTAARLRLAGMTAEGRARLVGAWRVRAFLPACLPSRFAPFDRPARHGFPTRSARASLTRPGMTESGARDVDAGCDWPPTPPPSSFPTLRSALG